MSWPGYIYEHGIRSGAQRRLSVEMAGPSGPVNLSVSSFDAGVTGEPFTLSIYDAILLIEHLQAAIEQANGASSCAR